MNKRPMTDEIRALFGQFNRAWAEFRRDPSPQPFRYMLSGVYPIAVAQSLLSVILVTTRRYPPCSQDWQVRAIVEGGRVLVARPDQEVPVLDTAIVQSTPSQFDSTQGPLTLDRFRVLITACTYQAASLRSDISAEAFEVRFSHAEPFAPSVREALTSAGFTCREPVRVRGAVFERWVAERTLVGQ